MKRNLIISLILCLLSFNIVSMIHKDYSKTRDLIVSLGEKNKTDLNQLIDDLIYVSQYNADLLNFISHAQGKLFIVDLVISKLIKINPDDTVNLKGQKCIKIIVFLSSLSNKNIKEFFNNLFYVCQKSSDFNKFLNPSYFKLVIPVINKYLNRSNQDLTLIADLFFDCERFLDINCELSKFIFKYFINYLKNKEFKTDQILIEMVKRGNLKLLRLFISHFDVNVQDDFGDTALIWAVRLSAYEKEKYIRMLKILIHYEANVNLENKYGYTPLSLSIIHDYEHLVDFFLKESKKIIEFDSKNKNYLVLAEKNNNQNILNNLKTYLNFFYKL